MNGKLLKKLNTMLWPKQDKPLSGWRGAGRWFFRLLFVLSQDLSKGQITLRAMSLVFTTLLAIVPLIAVSFSVLKAFGVHNQVEPLLLQLLEPLGSKGAEITTKIIGFVDNVQVVILGWLSFIFLFYTAISLIQKVESAFNYIWHLKQDRSWARRFSDYLSVLIVGPVLVFASLGISATVVGSSFVQDIIAIEPLGVLYDYLMRLMPYGFIIVAFTFINLFIPNTKVTFKAALTGGIISGIAWQTCGWIFATFVVSSTRYTAIYSGLAILIFFMMWVYLNWLILLLGASITYYKQYPKNMVLDRHHLQLSIMDQEAIGLELIKLIGQAFYCNQAPLTAHKASERLAVPEMILQDMLDNLEKGKLIVKTAKRPRAYVPAVPFDKTSLVFVLNTMRSVSDDAWSFQVMGRPTSAVNNIMQKINMTLTDSINDITIKDLIDTCSNDSE